MNNGSSLTSLLLLIIPIGVLIYFVKKKKKGSTNTVAKKRRDDDEVWKTLKSYIKKNSEVGKEIIESFVAKRPPVDFIDKSLSKEEITKQKKAIKEKHHLEKEKKKQLKKEGKRFIEAEQKELYVVLFTTRNPKTLVEDKPRAIECQVVNKKVDKKNFEREIIVTRTLEYDEEIKWILPIKEKEEAQFQKEKEKKEKNKAIKSKFKIKKSNDYKNNKKNDSDLNETKETKNINSLAEKNKETTRDDKKNKK
ncbi:MAG: DUF5385 family protein [Mycoplasmoidaceae bacterium]